MAATPDAPLFCPVCERPLETIWIWQDPGSSRIRMFCDDCSQLDEYASLPREQRASMDAEGFRRFAARRLLTHVLERERAKRAGVVSDHKD